MNTIELVYANRGRDFALKIDGELIEHVTSFRLFLDSEQIPMAEVKFWTDTGGVKVDDAVLVRHPLEVARTE